MLSSSRSSEGNPKKMPIFWDCDIVTQNIERARKPIALACVFNLPSKATANPCSLRGEMPLQTSTPHQLKDKRMAFFANSDE
jgi:hypothetical protein